MLGSVHGYCDSCTNDAEVKKESVQRFVAHAKRREKGIMNWHFENVDKEAESLNSKSLKIFNKCVKEGLQPYQLMTIALELIYLTLKNSGENEDDAIKIADDVSNLIFTEVGNLAKEKEP